jgi:hypothetical protein
MVKYEMKKGRILLLKEDMTFLYENPAEYSALWAGSFNHEAPHRKIYVDGIDIYLPVI